MKRKFLLAVLLCFILVSCDIFNPQKFADVVMVDGPRYQDGDTVFSYTGVVRNVGDGKATWVRIYIDLRNPNGDLLAQSYNLADTSDLEPGATSTWTVTFNDESRDLRDLMDESRTSYDITWSEAD